MGDSSEMRSRTKSGRGMEPTTLVGNRRPYGGFIDFLLKESGSSLRSDAGVGGDVQPVAVCQRVIFLGVDLHVIPVRRDEMDGDALLDHFLEQQNQISLFKNLRLAPGFAGELVLQAMKMLA